MSKNISQPNKGKDVINFKPIEKSVSLKEFKPFDTLAYESRMLNQTEKATIQDNPVFLGTPGINSISPAANTGRFAFTQSNYSPISSSPALTVPNMFQSNNDIFNLKTRIESPKSKSIKFRIVDEGLNGSGNNLKKLNLSSKTSTLFGGERNAGINTHEIHQSEIAKSTSIISQIKEYEADSTYKVTISKPGQNYSKDETNKPRFDNSDAFLKFNTVNSFPASILQKTKLSKQKYGRFISYDNMLFNGLHFENRDADGFKYACLVNKAALYDSNILQIGMISSLISSNSPNDKTFKLTLHYGNKTNDEISNFTVIPNSILRIFFVLNL